MVTEKIVDEFKICPHLKMVFRHKGPSVLKMVTMVDRYYCEQLEKGKPCVEEVPLATEPHLQLSALADQSNGVCMVASIVKQEKVMEYKVN